MQWLFELSAAFAAAAIVLSPAVKLLRPLRRGADRVRPTDRAFGFAPLLQPALVLAPISRDRRAGRR